MPTAFAVFPHGVIGNTTVFGTVILGSSPGGEADFYSPLTGVFAGCGLFFYLSRVALATFGDLRKRFSLRQNSVKTPSRFEQKEEGKRGGAAPVTSTCNAVFYDIYCV